MKVISYYTKQPWSDIIYRIILVFCLFAITFLVVIAQKTSSYNYLQNCLTYLNDQNDALMPIVNRTEAGIYRLKSQESGSIVRLRTIYNKITFSTTTIRCISQYYSFSYVINSDIVLQRYTQSVCQLADIPPPSLA